MSTYRRSPAPFVPPIPPDVTSSSESSPVLQSHSGFTEGTRPPSSAGLGRPGLPPQFATGLPPGSPGPQYLGVPGYGYPAFADYGEFQDYQEQMNGQMGMMQRYQQGGKAKPGAGAMKSPAQATAGLPGGGQMTQRGFYGAPPAFGYAPAPPPVGYGYSPYPQATPFPYAAAPGFPFGGTPGMFGAPPPPNPQTPGGRGGPPAGFMTPYMSPLPSQSLLDPPIPSNTAGPRPGGSVIGRPGQQIVETAVGKWFPGPDYAPVLDHLSFNIVKPPVVETHPLLRPISESRDSSDPFLVFDILFPPNTIHVSTEPPRKSWSKGRKDPATFPRLSVIRIISKYTPWVIQVTSDSPGGITVSDVISTVHEHFRVNASEDDDWNSVDATMQSEILMAYKWNRSTEMGAPGGIMPEALLRGDFLMERTMFAGIKLADPDLCEEKMGVKNFPATFELLLHTR